MTQPGPRDELTAALRTLRSDAGCSTTELARQLGWSQSKVSRIERGVTLAKPAEVDDWARVLRADPGLRRHLMELAEYQSVQLTEWKRAMAPGRRRIQEEIKEIEAGSSVIYAFSMNVLPGLAQTRPYAEAMFRLGRKLPIPQENLDEFTEARLARQAVLADLSKRFKLLFTEAALRRSLLPKNDMQNQIKRLLEIAQLPNAELGVIPFFGLELAHTYNAFAIWGDPDIDEHALVSIETVTRRLRMREPEEVRTYIDHYNDLAAAALYDDDLIKFLRDISVEAPWS